MNHFCTISTHSHLYKTLALADSVQNHGRSFILHVLMVDGDKNYKAQNCVFYNLDDLTGNDTAAQIIKKYKRASDKLRWSLKPVFLTHLLKNTDQKVVYVDNDQFFYNDYNFLFDLLSTHSILLTPHYYKHNPVEQQNWLEANYKVGLYNAGFLGASRSGIETLEWWGNCCLYRCEKNALRGLFDDQKYLDLVPVIDKNALVLRHQGCNVAGWNIELCKRTMVNGNVVINNEYPVVFVHYNAFTIRQIENGTDPLLAKMYEEYFMSLKKHKPDLNRANLISTEPFIEKLKYYIWHTATSLGL